MSDASSPVLLYTLIALVVVAVIAAIVNFTSKN
jgi:hypothetical protein